MNELESWTFVQTSLGSISSNRTLNLNSRIAFILGQHTPITKSYASSNGNLFIDRFLVEKKTPDDVFGSIYPPEKKEEHTHDLHIPLAYFIFLGLAFMLGLCIYNVLSVRLC